MELHEIHADMVTLEVTDKTTGETFRRELPIDFYETANFLRLRGEDLNGKPSELVFVSDTGMDRTRIPAVLMVKMHNNFVLCLTM